MNTRRIISFLIGFLIISLVALGTVFFLLRNAEVDLAETQRHQLDSYLLTQELRQSSDDLTRMVRAYVTTGDKDFERRYLDVLAIRNGEKARPVDYHRVYWDFIMAGQQAPRPDSEITKSFGELIQDIGFTREEIDKFLEGEHRSNQLSALELEAFNAVKGIYKDRSGNYARLDVPDVKLAQNLVFGKEYYQIKARIMQSIDEVYGMVDARTTKNLEVALDLLGMYQLILSILFLVSLLIIALIMYFSYKQAQADLAERQAAQEKAEEETEHLNDSVISILEAVNLLSQRDLTVRAPVTEDIIGTVSDSINLLADETAGVLHGVTDIAGLVSNVSDSVHDQATQVSQTAENERESVQKMFETLFEATQTMNQVAALAEQSNESAEQATEVTKDALQTVNSTVTGMESIRETISETEKRIKRLGERSQEISGIVNLINTISERTHVLALNASMQAAVAGEAGRGFAVVAEEVQQLAESSRNATEQIATLVNNIQIETNETINTVNRTIGQVVEGSEQAQQAGEQMRRTQEITAELVASVRSIANASQQQKDMSAQLLESVQEIGESTEKTAEQIAAQNAGTEELQAAAKQLVDSVNVFKLPQHG